jgi:L-arabinose transport system ATP-binding protein
MESPYLQFDSVSKNFPGVRALDQVSLSACEGSVHALIGENGAGKSTLLKILSGLYWPDAGLLVLGGREQHFRSTAAAISAGVAVIYQELQLVPELSVAENIYLGNLPRRMGWVNRKDLVAAADRQLRNLGERIDPRAKVSSLPIGQRQMVEIAKALARNAKVIAFDEPTSSLSARETERLFAVIDQLKLRGRVILYVSHRLEEIFEVCHSATVLRDGRLAFSYDSLAGVSRNDLVRNMVGRNIEDIFRYQPRPAGPERLRVEDLIGPGLSEPASFSVRAGEIVGFFGLVGAGRTELMKLIYGARRVQGGQVLVDGQAINPASPRQAIAAGIVLCPEDRKKEGIIPIRSVMENLNISGRRHFSRLGFFINEARERINARKHIERLAIRTPSLGQLVMNLSGGNQQKVILARWLSEQIKVILLDEPTRGIDVGAKGEIYSIIYELARTGIAVVVVSSELPEVLSICDRICVMREGSIVADIPRDQANQQSVLSLALPVSTRTQIPEAV